MSDTPLAIGGGAAAISAILGLCGWMMRTILRAYTRDADIYLIGQFASDAGKKAGEFFTPRRVSELLVRLADPQPGSKICDPACGSSTLLIRAAEHVAHIRTIMLLCRGREESIEEIAEEMMRGSPIGADP